MAMYGGRSGGEEEAAAEATRKRRDCSSFSLCCSCSPLLITVLLFISLLSLVLERAEQGRAGIKTAKARRELVIIFFSFFCLVRGLPLFFTYSIIVLSLLLHLSCMLGVAVALSSHLPQTFFSSNPFPASQGDAAGRRMRGGCGHCSCTEGHGVSNCGRRAGRRGVTRGDAATGG